MPPAVPLIAAVAGAAVTSAVGAGIAGAVAGTLAAAAINAVGSRALSKKPKSGGFEQEAQGRSVSVRSSVDTHKIIYGRSRVSGPLAFVATVENGVDNLGNAVAGAGKFLHMIIPVAGHEIDAFEAIYLNDQRVTLDANDYVLTAPYLIPFADGKSYARIKTFTGSPDQAASSEMLAECPGAWTINHRLRGIPYIHARFEYSNDAFPLGIPNVSAVIRGRKVYDPRTGLTVWSDNAALCIRDYLAADFGFSCDTDEINDEYASAAANVCDEPVLMSYGYQARYRCNGVVDTGNGPLDNLQQLVTSLAGAVTYVQGAFRIHAASYDAPVGEITNDMLAGSVSTVARPPRKDLFNAIKGTYVDPNKGWQPTDFPAVTNPTFEAQDNGERIFRDIELPFTVHPEDAQRIGKLLLEKSRQGIGQTLVVNHSALKYSVYDVITRTDPQHGWVNKPFRIMRFGIGVPGPLTMTIQEESSASYDWDMGEATTEDEAPDTDLPDAFTVQPPGVLAVTESKYVTRNGVVKARATLSWGASTDAFLRNYQPEYKLKSSTAWVQLIRTDAISLDIEDIAPGSYDFRVKALNGLGVSSQYSTASIQISGLLDPPPEPQNLTISTIGGLAILRWDVYAGNDTLDVTNGGKIIFRHSPDAGAGWAQSTTIGNSVAGIQSHAVLPLKPGIYLAKAEDSSGVQSVTAATVLATQATALAYANVDSLTEHPAFTGAKTGVELDGSTIKLTGTGQFDGIPDFDALPDLDAFGGIGTVGVYEFSGAMDLGSVVRVRLTSHVLASIAQVFDTIDSRIDDIDEWENFDGTDAAAGDAILYVRQTDDDPSGSPSWGAWQRLDSGEFEARAFQFKLEMFVTDGTYNISISELSITADEVA